MPVGGVNANSLYLSSNCISWDIMHGAIMFNVTPNEWVHWALVRKGDVWSTFRNGILYGQFVASGTLGSVNSGLTIGSFLYDANHYFCGYIDEFRVSNVARWAENFALPQHPYIMPTSQKINFGTSTKNLNFPQLDKREEVYIGVQGINESMKILSDLIGGA